MAAESKLLRSEHIIQLPGASWALWRCVALRGAGFPASDVLKLSAPECAEAADDLISAEAEQENARRKLLGALRDELNALRAEGTESESNKRGLMVVVKALRDMKKGKMPKSLGFSGQTIGVLNSYHEARTRVEQAQNKFHAAFSEASGRVSEEIVLIATSDRFQEAIIWQNRNAFHTGVVPLLRNYEKGNSRGSKYRHHEELIASYLQRYSVKNETIGFFGPVGWARLVPKGEAIVAKPRQKLLAKRNVYFEVWCINALAEALSKDKAIQPWIVPCRIPFIRVKEARAYLPPERAFKLTAKQIAVVQACDGGRVAKNIARDLLQTNPDEFKSEQDVYKALKDAQNMGLISWALGVESGAHPERALRRLLERIGDENLLQQALKPLNELEAARDAVALAVDNPGKLDQALADLETTFTCLTGVAPTRSAGKMYAARTLVYEDCQRDIELNLGPTILGSLASPMSLLLTSARWLTSEVRGRYRTLLRQIYVEMVGESERPVVEAAHFFSRIYPLAERENPANNIVPIFQDKWEEILVFSPEQKHVQYSCEQLLPKVMAAFDVDKAGWRHARYHCPDIMIAAPSVEAVQCGEYRLVLGEMHMAANTLGNLVFIEQHPDPEELYRAAELDNPGQGVVFIFPKDWSGGPKRTKYMLAPPNYFRLELGGCSIEAPKSRTLQVDIMVVEEVGDILVLRTRDGRLQFDLMDALLNAFIRTIISQFEMVRPTTHTPRISFDRLVVCRESWRLPVSEMTFANEKDDAGRFIAARRWARAHGMPRFVFVKAPVERKPFYVDFESPIFVNILAKVIRRTLHNGTLDSLITVSEMLPGLDEVWLPDAQNRNYTSEFRIVAVDLAKLDFVHHAA